jgi:hypothetical protein
VCNHLFVERAGRVCLEEPNYSCHMTMTYLAAGSHGFLRAELFHGPHGVERLDVAACLSGGGAFPAVGHICGLGGRCRRGRGGCPHPACGCAMAFFGRPPCSSHRPSGLEVGSMASSRRSRSLGRGRHSVRHPDELTVPPIVILLS